MCVCSIDFNLFANWELGSILIASEIIDFLWRPWFLILELITWKRKNLKSSLTAIVLINLN